MKSFFLLPLAFCFLFACSSDDDAIDPTPVPEPVPAGPLKLVTVEAKAGFDQVYDTWIVVQDDEGNVLDYRRIAEGTVTIETEKTLPGDVIGVTIVQASPSNSFYVISSELKIVPGKKYTFEPNPTRTKIGSFTINYSTTTPVDQAMTILSNKRGGALGSTAYSPTLLEFNTELYPDESDYFLKIQDTKGSLRYRRFADVKPGQVINISEADMLAFDKEVEFSFPESKSVMMWNTGEEPGDPGAAGYVIGRFNSYDKLITKARAGYLNSLSSNTMLIVGYSDYYYAYKAGNLLPSGNITWPVRADFEVIEKSFTGFKASTKKPFVYRESNWLYVNLNEGEYQRLYWNVMSPASDQKLAALPKEITDKYPGMTINKLMFEDTKFFVQSPSYSEVINGVLKGNTPWTSLAIGLR